MNNTFLRNELSSFIVEAKQSTYASTDDKARVPPILPGSHQLEFRKGSLFYRDIYYGGDFFVGLETVYQHNQPVWAMSYAGGVNDRVDASRRFELYDFLKSALRKVKHTAPYRGPEEFLTGDYQYTNRTLGQLSRFSGVEMISFRKQSIYQLHYSGGILKG